jgi:hypothetical protein
MTPQPDQPDENAMRVLNDFLRGYTAREAVEKTNPYFAGVVKAAVESVSRAA